MKPFVQVQGSASAVPVPCGGMGQHRQEGGGTGDGVSSIAC